MTARRPPALFLDRDGVINEEVGYLYRSEEVRWVEGIFALVRSARDHGYRTVVITNQSGIARGLYSTADFQVLMSWMRARFQEQGSDLDAVYHCPYHPVHGLGRWKAEHLDRKPGPGMLLRAERELGVDLSRSILVGDRCSDIAAANTAGLRQAFLKRGTEPDRCPGAAVTVDCLAEVQRWLEEISAREPERSDEVP